MAVALVRGGQDSRAGEPELPGTDGERGKGGVGVAVFNKRLRTTDAEGVRRSREQGSAMSAADMSAESIGGGRVGPDDDAVELRRGCGRGGGNPIFSTGWMGTTREKKPREEKINNDKMLVV